MSPAPAEPDDDRPLVALFLESRDEEAFRRLYRRHAPALWALALRLLGGDAPAAEEAVQEAWVRAVGALAGFRGESRLRTWLSGIVVHCCRERRRERPTEPLPDPDGPALESLRALAGGDLLRLELERALARLAAGFREVLLLHDVVGFTHQEIAERLGIDPGTSKSQLSRARAALRTLLGGPTPAAPAP